MVVYTAATTTVKTSNLDYMIVLTFMTFVLEFLKPTVEQLRFGNPTVTLFLFLLQTPFITSPLLFGIRKILTISKILRTV